MLPGPQFPPEELIQTSCPVPLLKYSRHCPAGGLAGANAMPIESLVVVLMGPMLVCPKATPPSTASPKRIRLIVIVIVISCFLTVRLRPQRIQIAVRPRDEALHRHRVRRRVDYSRILYIRRPHEGMPAHRILHNDEGHNLPRERGKQGGRTHVARERQVEGYGAID